MKKKIFVKISGKVQNSIDQMEILIEEIKKVSQEADVIFMHGGGVQITTYYEKLGLKPTFVNGLRKTDDEQVKVVEMVLSGIVNKSIVSRMLDHKISAIGISGRDNLIFAKEKLIDGVSLGNVGEVDSVNIEVLNKLFEAGFTPVISPVSNTYDYKPLNINADDAAEAVASALGVDYLVLLSDVSGIWDENKEVIPFMTLCKLACTIITIGNREHIFVFVAVVDTTHDRT